MSAQGTSLRQGHATGIRIRPAVALAVALAIGVLSGILIDRAWTSTVGAGQPAASHTAAVVPQPLPALGLRDDYATRHLSEFAVTVPTLTLNDDYATRHMPEPAVPQSDYRGDEATRHIGS
jgi:hypothetical protein